MKTAAIIPARLESSRFPEKLLFPILGKTLIQWTYENAKNCSHVEDVFIATDSKKIADHCLGFGAQVLMTDACENGTERLAKALQKYDFLNQYDLIVNIQGDHPCLQSSTISSTISCLESDPEAMVATAVIPLEDLSKIASPHTVKCVFNQQNRALYFSRSTIPFAAKKCYQHLGLYVYRKDFLIKLPSFSSTFLQRQEDLEQLKILELGYIIKITIVEDVDIAIDIPSDVTTLKNLLCQLNTSL
jgi:3-deoxy-manno-octulosonate cytidylyltransferase (CMP-KDO synthetase)